MVNTSLAYLGGFQGTAKVKNNGLVALTALKRGAAMGPGGHCTQSTTMATAARWRRIWTLMHNCDQNEEYGHPVRVVNTDRLDYEQPPPLEWLSESLHECVSLPVVT